MTAFRWLSPDPVPEELDLRQCGWDMSAAGTPDMDCIVIADAQRMGSLEWTRLLTTHRPDTRRFILVRGVTDPGERATLLRIGFGDAVGDDIEICELNARATRVAEHARSLPRHRQLGALHLDLLARQAFVDDKPINLNPREFALLWRLSDEPDEVVGKQTLIQDVWRLGFIPETNSIAVHMSRLRGKLAEAGLPRLIDTAQSGGYCLRTVAAQAVTKGRNRRTVRGDGARPVRSARETAAASL